MNLGRTEQRENLRFSLKVPLRIHFRNGELVMGHTVEVSEVGISAMIPVEIVVGQAVELDFQLPFKPICVQAVVKNKTAFRYGFEFVLAHEEREILKSGCRMLALRLNGDDPDGKNANTS